MTLHFFALNAIETVWDCRMESIISHWDLLSVIRDLFFSASGCAARCKCSHTVFFGVHNSKFTLPFIGSLHSMLYQYESYPGVPHKFQAIPSDVSVLEIPMCVTQVRWWAAHNSAVPLSTLPTFQSVNASHAPYQAYDMLISVSANTSWGP